MTHFNLPDRVDVTTAPAAVAPTADFAAHVGVVSPGDETTALLAAKLEAAAQYVEGIDGLLRRCWRLTGLTATWTKATGAPFLIVGGPDVAHLNASVVPAAPALTGDYTSVVTIADHAALLDPGTVLALGQTLKVVWTAGTPTMPEMVRETIFRVAAHMWTHRGASKEEALDAAAVGTLSARYGIDTV